MNHSTSGSGRKGGGFMCFCGGKRRDSSAPDAMWKLEVGSCFWWNATMIYRRFSTSIDEKAMLVTPKIEGVITKVHDNWANVSRLGRPKMTSTYESGLHKS